MSEVVFRHARPCDAELLAQLHRVSFFAAYPSFPRIHSHEEDVEHFKKVAEECTALIASNDGEPAGYCAFRTGWLDDLYIVPAFQGRGIGSHLLQKIKDENVELRLWTFQENKGARRFYERHGFIVEEETDGSSNEEKQPDVLYVWHGAAR